MIRTIITPQEQHISINIPKEFVGKQVEVLAFTIEETNGGTPFRNDETHTHFASEQVLAKDWMKPEEDEVWQNL